MYRSIKEKSIHLRICKLFNHWWFAGTSELEEAIKLAKKLCARKDIKIDSPSADDIEFNYIGSVQKNGDIDVEVKMKNIGKESRVVDIYITAIATKYTAVPSNDLKDSLAASVLEPGAGNVLL